MPMMGAVDTLRAKPNFPKERTEHGTVTQTVAANVAAGQSLITMSNTAGIQNGYIVQAYANNYGVVSTNPYIYLVNIGNNSPVTSGGSGILGFDQLGPSVVNVQGSLITLSRAITGPVNTGQQLIFSKPFVYKPNTYANTYNANTYLITDSRIANANSILRSGNTSQVAHTGWNYITVGTGFVKTIGWKNAGNQAVNGYINFYPNSQYDTLGTGSLAANASVTVNSNGSIINIAINSGGRYSFTPFANVPFVSTFANAANAVLVVTMGGRANRIQVETLAALSNAVAIDPNSGGLWAPGR